MERNKIIAWILFGLFLLANLAYIHRVPGLLGDEASEGENVYELHQREGVTVTGERSYIGPAIDYVRVPFIALFGYNAFALRILILSFSVATFWLASVVLTKHFGELSGLYALAALTFSPILLLYGRLGWAITLFPFFGFLVLYLLQTSWKTKWIWVGLAAGLGLANHIVFFPVLAGIAIGMCLYGVVKIITRQIPINIRIAAVSVLLVLVGFWAGFGMQFVVLALNTEDQGDPNATTQLFSERISAAFAAYPLYASGSSYVARYTGVEFSPIVAFSITWILYACMAVVAFVQRKNPYTWAWLLGCSIAFFVMLYMVDRFTLRYFYASTLIVWTLAGAGVGSVIHLFRKPSFSYGAPILGAVLALWMGVAVLIPFLQTGGSTADFSLGDRTNSASDFADIRPLISCLEGAGPVYSENIHIWNRLQYLSHSNTQLEVVPDEEKSRAKLLVQYRDKEHPDSGDVCPELTHFRILVAKK